MTTSGFSLDSDLFEKKISHYGPSVVEIFRRSTRSHSLFHILFAAAAVVEFLALVLFFSFWIESSTIAFLLAGICMTGFAYFVLLFYLQAKKPQQLLVLGNQFIRICKQDLSDIEESSIYCLSLSHAIYQMVAQLDHLESTYYRLPFRWDAIAMLLEKFSIFCHWKDVLKMREHLMIEAIQTHIQLVKEEPTDLEAHAALAKNYLLLSRVYQSPANPLSWIPPEYHSQTMRSRFQLACERAIEEFKIIDFYAPNDPWVHAQLAAIYHDLEDHQKEIFEYETMLHIAPGDKAVMFKLGILYFQHGQTAKGLRMYDELKKAKETQAAELLQFYDSFSTSAFLSD